MRSKGRTSFPLWVTVCLLLTLAVPICCDNVINDNWPPHHAWETELTPSQSINVNLFLDASRSMRGFLASGQENRYLPVVEQLAGIARSGGWKNCQVKWWKFGAHAAEIPEQNHLIMESPDFYGEATTQIDEVFRNSNSNDLTVVVTDLFQSRADVDLLSSRLNERYLAGMRQAGAGGPSAATPVVAVLGIETRFNGRVSELREEGGGEHSIPHNGTLPYYILIFGPLQDVDRFLQLLDYRFNRLSPELLPHTRRVLFSERPVRKLATKVVPGPKRVGFSIEHNLMPGSTGDERIIQLQVPSMGSKKPADAGVVEALLDCDLLASGLDLDATGLRAEVKGESPGAGGKFQADPALAEALNVKSIKLEGNRLRLTLELLRERLRNGKDYRFEVRVFPVEDAYRLPQSMLTWSLASSEVHQILAQQGFTPKGVGRTLNLAVFLQNLRDATFNGKQLPIGIVYFYVKAS